MKKNIHPQIVNAFHHAKSNPDDDPCNFIVSNIDITSLPLRAMEGPFRDFGYITLPRLTFTSDPIGYFTFGWLLVNSAISIGAEKQCIHQISLNQSASSNIITLVVSIWKFEDDLSFEKNSESSVIEWGKDVSWLSPLAGFNLNENELPLGGVIRRQLGFRILDKIVPCNGSAAYLSVSTRGAIALGKILIYFSICSDSEFIQFEQVADRGGCWPNEL